MKPTLTIIAVLITALALATNQPPPKAEAAPVSVDQSAKIAAMQEELYDLADKNSDLVKENVRLMEQYNAAFNAEAKEFADSLVADAPAIHAAPAAEGPSAGVLKTAPAVSLRLDTESRLATPQGIPGAGVVSLPRPLARSQSCAGGQCQLPAQEPRRYQPPPRSRGRLFPIFGRR